MKASKKLLFPMLATQVITGLLSVVFAQVAHGANDSQYIWSDSKGFQSASLCQESIRTEIPFSVIDGKTVKVGNSRVMGRALVARKADLKSPGYKFVKMIGKKDQGYVKQDAVVGMDEYVLEVKNSDQTLRAGNTNIKMNESFWQAAMTDDKFKTIDCGAGADKKTYAVFEVFTAESMDPLATVGVAADEAKIFHSVVIDNADEAEAKLGGPESMDGADDQVTPMLVTNQQNSLTSGKALSLGKKEQSLQLLAQKLAGGATISTAPAAKTTTAVTAAGSGATVAAVPATTGATPAAAATADANTTDANAAGAATVDGVPVVNSLDYVVCSDKKGLRVRDDSLQNVRFTVDGLDEVKLVQSWGTDKKEMAIDGKVWTFVKVQVPDEEGANDTGWIAADFIKEKSKCELVKKDNEVTDKVDQVNKGKSITGLDDKNCCTFPTLKRTTDSYKTGMRRFGAGRSHGKRIHAAADLYRQHGEGFVAIANGTVIRDRYMFYQGVYALEVVHEGGFVVRYGEILSKTLPGVKAGHKVKAGETLGYIGTVNSGCCKPMLHFEVYSGKAKGALTQLRRRPMQRRQDVINPTDYLSAWERRQFGTSY